MKTTSIGIGSGSGHGNRVRFRNVLLGLLGGVAFTLAGCEGLEGETGQPSPSAPDPSAQADEAAEPGSAALNIAGGEAGLRAALGNCKNGDILLARGPLVSGIPAPWAGSDGFSHAGLFDKEKFDAGDPNCILSAHATLFSSSGSDGYTGVGYESIPRWATEDVVAVYRVKNHTDDGARRAVAFARGLIGKGYNITATLNDNKNYYCSKVVYRAWNSVGIPFNTFWIYGINLTDKSLKLYYSSPNNLAESASVARFDPELTPATCGGTAGQWAGCQVNGCAVCAENLTAYPRYFQNHPNCVRNTTCAGQSFTCNAACPAPSAADR